MAKTEDNLRAALSGESQANQKYLSFAKKAEAEGYPAVARLFRAVAAAETVHAQNHLDAMGIVGYTADNLKAAIEGEAAEFESMYPEFLDAAREEANEAAEQTFDQARQVEQIHHAFYSEAAGSLARGEDLPYANVYVCRGCGNTVRDEVPERCPICGAPKSWFMWVG